MKTKPTFRQGWVVLLMALAATVANAQDAGFGAAFKLRAGFGLSGAEDQLSRKSLGLGFEVGYTLPAGRLGLELGYQYKPGNQFLTNVATMPKASGMTVDASQSVDSRKNQLGGVAARFSYEKPLMDSPFALRVGLQVGGAKFRQEYIGDVTNGVSYEDTYNGIATTSASALSPFVGLRYDIDPEQALECNLLALSYTSANYVHVAGTVPGGSGGNTSWDYVATQKRTQPHIEFCYVLRF